MSQSDNTAGLKSTSRYARSADMRAYDRLPETIRRLVSTATENISAVQIHTAIEKHGRFTVEYDLAAHWQPLPRVDPPVLAYYKEVACRLTKMGRSTSSTRASTGAR